MAWTRLSRKRGLRLMRDSSARMSSYWRSMYPAISWKLYWRTSHSQRDQLPATAFSQRKTYVNSLSMLSPNPGVSTIVNEILTPSSSSSASSTHFSSHYTRRYVVVLTDGDGLDSDALLDVCSLWVVANLVWENLRLAECVHKRRATSSRRT